MHEYIKYDATDKLVNNRIFWNNIWNAISIVLLMLFVILAVVVLVSIRSLF